MCALTGILCQYTSFLLGPLKPIIVSLWSSMLLLQSVDSFKHFYKTVIIRLSFNKINSIYIFWIVFLFRYQHQLYHICTSLFNHGLSLHETRMQWKKYLSSQWKYKLTTIFRLLNDLFCIRFSCSISYKYARESIHLAIDLVLFADLDLCSGRALFRRNKLSDVRPHPETPLPSGFHCKDTATTLL